MDFACYLRVSYRVYLWEIYKYKPQYLYRIASYRTMESRIRQIKAQGMDAEIKVFDGLSHGLGLGEGTVAEGWLDRVVSFWERNQ